ncbi:MAG TPA: hypothetical protein VGK73_35855, partial [Polyangiaceae bacterium]
MFDETIEQSAEAPVTDQPPAHRGIGKDERRRTRLVARGVAEDEGRADTGRVEILARCPEGLRIDVGAGESGGGAEPGALDELESAA